MLMSFGKRGKRRGEGGVWSTRTWGPKKPSAAERQSQLMALSLTQLLSVSFQEKAQSLQQRELDAFLHGTLKESASFSTASPSDLASAVDYLKQGEMDGQKLLVMTRGSKGHTEHNLSSGYAARLPLCACHLIGQLPDTNAITGKIFRLVHCACQHPQARLHSPLEEVLGTLHGLDVSPPSDVQAQADQGAPLGTTAPASPGDAGRTAPAAEPGEAIKQHSSAHGSAYGGAH
eukprot:scaffold55351_cov16-Tisochrysis_lutea.AAC.1